MTIALQPFYTPGDSGLYACLHPDAPSARTGALCVQPLFGEYIQHHRAFVLLAERLAAKGIPTLRYDHHATGDSADDLASAAVSRWSSDIEAMSAELVRRTAVQRIILIGARFGAALALTAAARIVRTSGLVLWEPVWNGSAFLDSLLRTHERVLAPYFPPAHADRRNGSHDVLGFEIPERLWNEIRAFEPHPRLPPDLDVLLIGSTLSIEDAGCFEDHERLARQQVNYPNGWLDPERGMYDVLVPAGVLTHVVRWCEARS